MKNFKEKLLDCGLNDKQVQDVEKICLNEMETAEVSGGGGICYCPYCHVWIPERVWEDHKCNNK